MYPLSFARFGGMDNIWQQYGDTNQAYGNVTYTPGIDLTLSPGNDLTQFQDPAVVHGPGPIIQVLLCFHYLWLHMFIQSVKKNVHSLLFQENQSFSSTSQVPQPVNDRRKKGVAKREKNYSNLEDETLCSAYLNVSKDPVVGVNQPMKSYWARITDYFNEMRTTDVERSSSSLQHRWGDISRDTALFCSYYAEIERKHQSGKSEDDKV
jgi:hypothetical protein